MADTFTTNLNIDCPEVGASNNTWGTKQNAGFQIVDAIFDPAGGGTSVGINVQGKTLKADAASVVITDATDRTKIVNIDASGITTGNTRTLKVPDASGTLMLSSAFVLRNYISGLTMSNDSGTPNSKIDIAAGQCADDTNAVMINNGSALVINCGTNGANGLDTGALAASTWYHAFVIATAAGATAGFASTSLTPTLPATYTVKRRVGSFKTDASAHILGFAQVGDVFQWNLQPMDATAIGATHGAPTSTVVSVPPSVSVMWQGRLRIQCTVVGGFATVDVYTPGAIGAGLGPGVAGAGTTGTATANSVGAGFASILVTNGQIVILATTNNATVDVSTAGWIDFRGKT